MLNYKNSECKKQSAAMPLQHSPMAMTPSDNPHTSEQQGSLWANELPSDLLSLIASKCVASAAEYVTLGHVCRDWCRSLTNYSPLPPLPSPQLPFLFIPRGVYGPELPVGNVCPLPFHQPHRKPTVSYLTQLDVPDGCICVGSSHGWLIVLGPDSSISLLNPVTSDSIHLPPLSSIDSAVLYFDRGSYPEYHLRKKQRFNSQSAMIHRAVLSSDPAKDPGFTVLLFFSGLTDSCFTCSKDDVTWRQHLHDPFLVEDVIFFNKVFVAINVSTNLAVFDFSDVKTGLVMKVQKKTLLKLSPKEAFLVEAEGDLLLVVTCRNFNRPIIIMSKKAVQVFLIVTPENDGDGYSNARALEIALLSQRSLFVGHGCSVGVPVQLLPSMAKGKVYFRHVYARPRKDEAGRTIILHYAGVYEFNVRSKVTRKVFSVEHGRFAPLWDRLRFYWVTPNLNRI